MANPGIYPLDPSSEVGRFRLLIGDTTSTPLDPPVSGKQDYRLFSDDEIEAFLSVSDSMEAAAYAAFMQLAGQAALESRSVKDLDLQVDLTKRATDLRLIAFGWRDRADALGADVFELFDVSIDNGCDCAPELAANVVCWGCSNGVRFF